jgi:hypothetical protein
MPGMSMELIAPKVYRFSPFGENVRTLGARPSACDEWRTNYRTIAPRTPTEYDFSRTAVAFMGSLAKKKVGSEPRTSVV